MFRASEAASPPWLKVRRDDQDAFGRATHILRLRVEFASAALSIRSPSARCADGRALRIERGRAREMITSNGAT